MALLDSLRATKKLFASISAGCKRNKKYGTNTNKLRCISNLNNDLQLHAKKSGYKLHHVMKNNVFSSQALLFCLNKKIYYFIVYICSYVKK